VYVFPDPVCSSPTNIHTDQLIDLSHIERRSFS
jgi:hypothetical protein